MYLGEEFITSLAVDKLICVFLIVYNDNNKLNKTH